MKNEKPKTPVVMERRAVLKSVLVGIGVSTIGQSLFACSDKETAAKRPPDTTEDPNGEPKSEEYVPGESTPATSEAPTSLPNLVWEGRVRQLEAEQESSFRKEVFTAASPGVNKDAHVPNASIVDADGGAKAVKVVVNHVMGKNLLDGGMMGTGMGKDGGKDAGDGGDGGGDAGDAGDAGTPVSTGPTIVHYITTMYLRAMVDGKDTVVGLWELVQTDPAPPTVIFKLPPGVTSVTAYEWCTLHGLWAGTELKIT